MARLIFWLGQQQGARLWLPIFGLNAMAVAALVAFVHWVFGHENSETHLVGSIVIASGASLLSLPLLVFLIRNGAMVHSTSRKLAESESTAAQQKLPATLLRLVSDHVTDMIWAKDLNKRFLFTNKAICEQMLGASSTDEPIGRDDLFFARRAQAQHPDNPQWYTFGEQCQATDEQTLRNGRATTFEVSGYLRGQPVALDVRKAPLLDGQGQVIGVVGSARDITAQRALQDKLRLAALVFESSSEAMLVTDADNRIVDVNPAFCRMTGYPRDEVIGRDPSLLHSGHQSDEFYRAMWQELKANGQWRGELWNKRKNGEVFAEWLTINTILHDDGSVHRRVALFFDITEKKRVEEMVWQQANFDALTKLPNRRLFHDRLQQDLLKAHRSGNKLGLFFIDLDHFKEVNDSLGHDAGDQLLVEAASRITASVRASDTVARLAGDEFTVTLPNLDELSRVGIIADGIIRSLTQTFQVANHTVSVSASIGIAVFPDDAADLEGLIQSADQAMYAAKRHGRNGFCLCTRAMQLKAREHLDLMAQLRLAMTNGQLKLFFQPVICLQTGQMKKVEALLRWFHPKRGLIGPNEFIPLAEEHGMIHSLGDWVFGQAVKQAHSWSARFGKDFKISLNVSPMQLLRASVHRIRWQEQLAACGISGQRFVIEISEGLLHHPSAAVNEQLDAFRDAGTQVAIDHLGAGFSSFADMRRRQIAYFKIEKSTIDRLLSSEQELALAQALVVMAHQLGLKVIAEGVETQAQHQALQSIGCDLAQGFLYSKPVAATDVEAFFLRDESLSLAS